MQGAVRRLAMFPLGTVLYPHAPLTLHVFEPRYRRMTLDCLAGDRELGVVLIERGSEVGGGEVRTRLGTIAHLEVASPLPGGRWLLVARGGSRLRVHEWLPDDPYPLALVEELEVSSDGASLDEAVFDPAIQAVRRSRALLSELGEAPALPTELELGDDADAAAWRLCALAPITAMDAQRLLGIGDPSERLALLAELVGAVADDLSGLLGTD